MADPKIKFKRSAVAGKIPTAAQVPLGEIALNTNDGILYASKDVGAGTTVIAVNPFRVGTGTDSYNTFFTAGNVGIASTQPTGKLDVIGQVNIKATSTTTPGTSHSYDPNYIDDSHGGSGTVTLSNSNKTFTTGAAFDGATATPVIPTSGKHYWEYHFGVAQILFTISPNQNQGTFANANGAANYGFRVISKAIVNGSETFVNAIATAWNNIANNSSKTIGVAYDADNGTLAMYFDGTLVHTISSVPTNTTYYIHTSVENANKPVTIAFDSSDWNQSAPSGFSSLNTAATTTTSNNHLNVSGITTTSVLKVGTGITASGGIVTATTFSGSGASLTNLPAANITGTLPAISGANLTNLNGSNISSGTVTATRVGALPASKITTGTFDAARIPTLNQNTTGTAALAEGLTGSPNITVSDVNVGGGLSVTGNSFFVGVVTFAAGTDGNIILGDTATDNVVFNADVNSNIVPNTNNAYDLGSSSQKWRNLFISGNANIGGTLTYEDVTNIDSVGLSTFRAGVNITGTATATLFSGSGASLTNLNATNLASGTIPDARFPAALPAIDGSALTGITASGTGAIGGLTIKNQSGAVVGTAGSVSTIDFDGSTGVTVTATTGAAGIATVLISADLVTDTSPQLGGNLDLNGNNITGSGNIPAANLTGTLPAIDGSALTGIDIGIAGDSGTGTVNTSQSLTISGTANEIVTAASGQTITLSLPTTVTNDNFETTAAGRVTTGLIASQNNTDGLTLATGGGKKWLVGRANAEVELYYNNNLKFETTNDGAVITGILTATSFNGNLTGGILDSNGTTRISATTSLITLNDDTRVNGHLRIQGNQIRNSAGNATIIFSGNDTSINGDLNMGVGGASITQNNGLDVLTFTSGSNELTAEGEFNVEGLSNLKLGAVVTGVCTATSFSGDGSNLTNISASIAGISTAGTSTFNHVSVTGVATVSTAFYLPQYTTTARDAGTFNEGAMIYNTTTKKMEFYDGTNWNTLPGVTLGLGMGVF